MPLIKTGYIYELSSGDKTYIGSTTYSNPRKRLATHKAKYNAWKDNRHHYVSSFDIFETNLPVSFLVVGSVQVSQLADESPKDFKKRFSAILRKNEQENLLICKLFNQQIVNKISASSRLDF